MLIILILFIIALLLISVLTFKLLYIIKHSNFKKTISFLEKYIIIILSLLIFIYSAYTIYSISNTDYFVFIYIANAVISTIYFIIIFSSSKKLLKNLKNEIIFDDQNAVEIRKIGTNFLYLAITEIVTGLLLNIVLFMSRYTDTFSIQTNLTIFIYITIGVILLIIDFILKKAIEIDRENKLTI
ncbi:DUF2975 domain-containing protein [Haploplasma axanthum]|nr:DUF2975 domain-containing protein [Haploplasma axanthum]